MRRVSVSQLRPGMIIARTVFGAEGQRLLNTGAEIRNQYIRHLKNLEISSVYIQDSRMEGVVVEDVVSDETRIEACSLVRDLMLSTNGNGYASRLCSMEKQAVVCVNKIVDELLSNGETVINLVDIKTADNYTFAHCVNVCVLSVLTAKKLDYSRVKIKKVALGSLLHDLGKVHIPEDILNKPGNLSEKEFEIVKRHPVDGLEIFKHNTIFSAMAGEVILQHHERSDGRGYPLGLKGDEINQAAQVVSVADVYDALTSDRPYRHAYQPHQVIEMFSVADSSHHDIAILRSLLSFVAAYPVGTHVLLSNNESGLVVNNTAGYPLRPKVRVLYNCIDSEIIPHNSPYEIDLTEALELVVRDVLDDKDPQTN